MEITTSKISAIDRATTYHTQFPWEEFGAVDIKGGSEGRVIVRSTGKVYKTAFVEVYGGQVPFIRGEAGTVAEAEAVAWEKFQKVLACPGHDYEPRGYTNGAGFCRHCNAFDSQVFTAEELGQFCHVCSAPTFITVKAGFTCPEHHPGKVYQDRMNELDEIEDWTDEQDEEYWDLSTKYLKVASGLDPEGEWA